MPESTSLKLKPLPPLRRDSRNESLNPKTEGDKYEEDNSCNHVEDDSLYNHASFEVGQIVPPPTTAPVIEIPTSRKPAFSPVHAEAALDGEESTEGDHAAAALTKSQIARLRWTRALWWATQEAQRRKALAFQISKSKSIMQNKALILSTTRFKSLLVRGRKVSPEDPSSPPPRLQKRFSTDSSDGWMSGKFEQQRDTAWSTVYSDDMEEMEAVSSKKDDVASAEKEKKKAKSERDVKIENFLESKGVIYLNIICTMWILCGDDVYILLNPPLFLDRAIFSVNFACFFVFLVDFLLRMRWEPKYLSSFYFWLDLISLLSLLPDVIWFMVGIDILNIGKNVSDLARSGRAASAGARVARIIRILQLLSRINRLRNKRIGQFDNELGDNSVSELAKKLDTYISMHVVISVGVTLVLSFSLSAAYSFRPSQCLLLAMRGYSATLAPCVRRGGAEVDETCLQGWKATMLQDLVTSLDVNATTGTPLIYLELSNIVLYGNDKEYLNYRQRPRSWSEISFSDLPLGDGTGVMHVSILSDVQDTAIGNLLTVLSILMIICLLALTLSASMRRELVGPMARIVHSLELLMKDPLGNLHDVLKEERAYEVENAIVRIGNLLQLGFGEAGAKIISASMKDGNMDTTKGGKVVNAIFGFCDIRNFTDCTEVLRADIVKLVNDVARIVHTATKENFGAPNKNIGDAFLLVWKPKGQVAVHDVADSALKSYVRIILELQCSKQLRRWSRKSLIQLRLPGFTVRMGFGLHFGWAIEGAIGSSEKIDASYLSPHVNTAARLEAATKQYGVQILLSGAAFELLSDPVRALCRFIDRVTVKGSVEPVKLYTYDCPCVKSHGGVLEDTINPSDPEMTTKEFFEYFAPSTTQKFRQEWRKAMKNYLGEEGGANADWRQARIHLLSCFQENPSDGPTLALLNVIKEEGRADGSAPVGWQGYRALTDK